MKSLVYTGPDYCVPLIEEKLGNQFEIIHVEPTPNSLFSAFKECTVFLDASMKVNIDRDIINDSQKLDLVVTATTGANHIDKSALDDKNIQLLTLKGQVEVLNSLTPAAELTWALIMSCARHLRAAYRHVEDKGWERTQFPGLMLKEKTIGIIGFGRIGSWIARYANAFDMKILCYDPSTTRVEDYVEMTSLEYLVSSSDIISIHVHLTNDTKGMLNKTIISQFKKGSIFVNTSRGELTDENALVNALESGSIQSVGLDVLSNEPNIIDNPLWRYAKNHDNVHITPHIGGFCPDAVKTVVSFSCDRVKEFYTSV
jgi:phosphoglycerate dehydrogenase-like enzyme